MFVCKDLDDKSCLPCGVARETSPGKWTTIFCTGEKVEGNRLWVTHSYDRLQVCELEIYGMQISEYSFHKRSISSRNQQKGGNIVKVLKTPQNM